jgi:tetratricopeptide (TPR) repeat protein
VSLRKEHVVLITTGLLVGYLAWSSLSGPVLRNSRGTKSEPPPFPHQVVPDLGLVLPKDRAAQSGAAKNRAQEFARARELFSPPSDTEPLPPLELITPPHAALALLRPPPEPGPSPKLYGRFLRTPLEPFDAPDLFAQGIAAEGAPDDGNPGSPAAAAAPVGVPRASAAGAAAATPPSIGGNVADTRGVGELSPQERADRVAGYKKLYDWLRIVDIKFGQIQSPDRYALSKHPDEDILFVEFNPETGLPRIPGQAPIPFKRANVAEFGFADTVLNQIELRRAEFGDPLSAGEYDQAILFGKWCLEQRLETPRALEVAEEIFQRAMPVLKEDPLPHIGLARCYEAGFQFEKAFQEYNSLLTGSHGRDPLVLINMAMLETRFRLFEKAEARFAEAERYGRTQWPVQWRFGQFLLQRGRPEEAAAHLRLANQNEPSGAEFKRERAQMRTDLGAALLAQGQVTEAAEWFDKARQADPQDQRALAGSISAALLSKGTGSDGSAAVAGGPSAVAAAADLSSVGFEMLVATALENITHHDAAGAKQAKAALLLAASTDPLRAYIPWRSLSYLAEITHNPEDALRFIEQAYENNPTDAWTLYQRGRLRAARDDLDGAQESFTRALDLELDFPDALAAMGELAYRRGDNAAAERYLERAVSLDPKSADVMALRGLNYLELGALNDAETTFKRALDIDHDQPTAWNGLAWCYYRKGDPTAALAKLRDLDDNRRAFPEDDPQRVWARSQIARLQDHIEKVVWTDRFERNALRNDWTVEETDGPQFSIHDGLVTMSGTFTKQNGRARMWQKKSAGSFVAIEARVTVHSGTTSRVGLFVSREISRSGETQIEAEVTLSRHNDAAKNMIQTRVMKRGEEDLPYTDVAGFEWKLDTPVLLRIERTGESSDTRVRCSIDGIPVLENKPMPSYGRTNMEVRVGIFAKGDVGRQVQVDIDDIQIIYRDKK